MAFVQYLRRGNIHIHQPLKTKEEVLAFLASIAAEAGLALSREVLLRRLEERERTMSTGIGNAVGVPHILVEGIRGMNAFVITLRDPIPFDAVDGKSVSVVIGMLGDPEHPNTSLSALATLGRMLRDESFVLSLWEAGSPEDVYLRLLEKETGTPS